MLFIVWLFLYLVKVFSIIGMLAGFIGLLDGEDLGLPIMVFFLIIFMVVRMVV